MRVKGSYFQETKDTMPDNHDLNNKCPYNQQLAWY